MLGPKPRAAIGRFLEKIEVAESGCWEWQAALRPKPWNYGVFAVGSASDGSRRRVRAHRFSYEHYVGPIPDELELDHLCRNPPCVNPDHLEAVTGSQNVRRGTLPVLSAERQHQKTHCPRGHQYDLLNTYFDPRGWRQCRECRANHWRR